MGHLSANLNRKRMTAYVGGSATMNQENGKITISGVHVILGCTEKIYNAVG